ncbi:hypothetical protein FVE85_8262 [Porphyridium purpureum]|uniref:VWFA domain-containing protein n=1 Tax=Porphyridium purpureum TaxID=35688 RepID=A0A5J4YLJ8_PORPP|nr:hypothetical protein FVE85_8262 [Porphyridium purpureum]|eukprot:POR0304..scf244_11
MKMHAQMGCVTVAFVGLLACVVVRAAAQTPGEACQPDRKVFCTCAVGIEPCTGALGDVCEESTVFTGEFCNRYNSTCCGMQMIPIDAACAQIVSWVESVVVPTPIPTPPPSATPAACDLSNVSLQFVLNHSGSIRSECKTNDNTCRQQELFFPVYLTQTPDSILNFDTCKRSEDLALRCYSAADGANDVVLTQNLQYWIDMGNENPGGFTSIGFGIAHVQEVSKDLHGAINPPGSTFIFVLTDGEENGCNETLVDRCRSPLCDPTDPPLVYTSGMDVTTPLGGTRQSDRPDAECRGRVGRTIYTDQGDASPQVRTDFD